VNLKLPMGSIDQRDSLGGSLGGRREGRRQPIGNFPAAIGKHEVTFRHPELGEAHQNVTVTMSGPARLSVDLRKK
jgi:hypothetical protein